MNAKERCFFLFSFIRFVRYFRPFFSVSFCWRFNETAFYFLNEWPKNSTYLDTYKHNFLYIYYVKKYGTWRVHYTANSTYIAKEIVPEGDKSPESITPATRTSLSSCMASIWSDVTSMRVHCRKRHFTQGTLSFKNLGVFSSTPPPSISRNSLSLSVHLSFSSFLSHSSVLFSPLFQVLRSFFFFYLKGQVVGQIFFRGVYVSVRINLGWCLDICAFFLNLRF